MVTTQKRIQRNAIKLTFAALVFMGFGAAVVAAPFALTSRPQLVGNVSEPQAMTLAPLASGPAIQLASAGDGESEDCVRVTKMTGPDGKVYPTRGLVCGGAE